MSLLEAIKFVNVTEEDFVGMYDGHPYEIPAKAVKFFAPHVAEHFAKHLVNKILTNEFEELCKEHSSSTKDLLKTCKNCKNRSDKQNSFYDAPERKLLLETILPKGEVKQEVKPPVEPDPTVE